MRIALGLALVVVGAIDTLAPIVRGLALVLAGITVLGPQSSIEKRQHTQR